MCQVLDQGVPRLRESWTNTQDNENRQAHYRCLVVEAKNKHIIVCSNNWGLVCCPGDLYNRTDTLEVQNHKLISWQCRWLLASLFLKRKNEWTPHLGCPQAFFLWGPSDEVRGKQLKAFGTEQSNIDYNLPIACTSSIPYFPLREKKKKGCIVWYFKWLILFQQVWYKMMCGKDKPQTELSVVPDLVTI